MRSQESLNELSYLRAIKRVVDNQSNLATADIGYLRQLMRMMYWTHGIAWKARGCSGSREHDQLASNIVDRALDVERRALSRDGRAADFDNFDGYRCEPCGWDYLVLYLQRVVLAELGADLNPKGVIGAHKGWHTRERRPNTAINAAVQRHNERAQIEADAPTLIAMYLQDMANAGLLSDHENAE